MHAPLICCGSCGVLLPSWRLGLHVWSASPPHAALDACSLFDAGVAWFCVDNVRCKKLKLTSPMWVRATYMFAVLVREFPCFKRSFFLSELGKLSDC